MQAREHHRESQLPVDGGLSSLGLLMQLGAAINVGCMVLFLTDYFVADAPIVASSHMPTIAILGIARSWLHFTGARSLLYPNERTNLGRAAALYIVFSFVHAIVTMVLLRDVLTRSVDIAAVGVVLLAWPVTLGVIACLPRFKPFAEGPPIPDDLGFEGVSLVMLVLGLAGALWAAMMLGNLLDASGAAVLTSELGVALFAVYGALLARGVLHVLTGHAGATGGTPTAINAAAARYYNAGIAVALGAGGVLFIMSLDDGMTSYELFRIVFVVYALLAWPVLLRWFFGVRGISTIAAADDEQPHRAPDRGLVSLGWLLLATAVFMLAIAIPRAAFGGRDYTVDVVTFGALHGGDLAALFGRSSMYTLALGCLQLWVAIELVWMSARRRLAATIYAVAGGGITVYVMLPFLRNWQRFMADLAISGQGWHTYVLSYSQLALALVAPLATLALVHRRVTPHATARFVTEGDA